MVWLRIFAAAILQRPGKNNVIGLAQDVTFQRQSCLETDPPYEYEQPPQAEEDPGRKLRNDISSSLTSILMNCEILLDERCAPERRRGLEAILAEALRIDRFLQQYRG